MFNAFLILRYRQIQRSLEGIGIFRFIFLMVLILGAFYAIFSILQKGDYDEFVTGGLLLILLFVQLQRKDIDFLKINLDNYRKLLWMEYLLLLAPLSGILIFTGNWFLLAVTISSLIILPFIKLKIQRRSLNTKMQLWIPAQAIEWKSGLRKGLFAITAVWLMGIVFSFFVGAVPLAIFIIGVFPLKFYEIGEPLPVLMASERSPAAFLTQKIKHQFIIFSVISFPLIVVFSVFHIGLWYIAVVEFLVLTTLHVYFILLKYAFYEPNQKTGAIEIFSGIGVVGLFVPVFLPLVWLLSVRFYFRAITNLKCYLNDFNQ